MSGEGPLKIGPAEINESFDRRQQTNNPLSPPIGGKRDVPGMRHAVGGGAPMELQKPDIDVGAEPGPAAVRSIPGV